MTFLNNNKTTTSLPQKKTFQLVSRHKISRRIDWCRRISPKIRRFSENFKSTHTSKLNIKNMSVSVSASARVSVSVGVSVGVSVSVSVSVSVMLRYG